MPRRRRRVSRLSLFYFVVTLGLLVGGSVWLDRRGEVTTARVASKQEEITVQQVPAGGWIRWYRVGVEFGTRDGRTYRDRNRYHFLVPMMGLGLLGMLGAWGWRHGRVRWVRTASSGNAAPLATPSARTG